MFALCYGYGFREQFEEVVRALFGADAFAWSGKTLCVLAPGPTSHLRGKHTPWSNGEWWIELGRRMRSAIHEQQTTRGRQSRSPGVWGA